jgi:photosystem II stability/assembly factor-like uncharacterized protein
MADRVTVCVGTKRGLFLLESNHRRHDWKLRGPFLVGWQVYHAILDTRGSPKIHVAGSSDVFGSTSFNGGSKKVKFGGAKKPPIPPKLMPGQLKVARQYGCNITTRIWHIEPGSQKERGVLYAGSAPAALFRSEDGGKTWEPVKGLLRHPTRKDWAPGFGGLCLHSIQVDPENSQRIVIAISAAGAFRSEDGGRTWKSINRAVAKYIGAPKDSEVGSCVHKLLLHPAVPGRMYQQNHVGVYQSDDYGDTWYAIHKGLPSDFGFGLALHARRPEQCYVVPLDASHYAFRATPGALRVYGWNGKTRKWSANGKGLPSHGAHVNVLREGLSADSLDPVGVYMGTGSGQVYCSADEGRSWRAAAENLPPVLSISVGVV